MSPPDHDLEPPDDELPLDASDAFPAELAHEGGRMSAHTSGPWKVEGATVIWSPTAAATIAAASGLRDSQYVAFQAPRIGSPDFEEIAANARLIAEAPTMLDILQTISKALDNGMPASLILDENSPLRDAIREVLRRIGGAV